MAGMASGLTGSGVGRSVMGHLPALGTLLQGLFDRGEVEENRAASGTQAGNPAAACPGQDGCGSDAKSLGQGAGVNEGRHGRSPGQEFVSSPEATLCEGGLSWSKEWAKVGKGGRLLDPIP